MISTDARNYRQRFLIALATGDPVVARLWLNKMHSAIQRQKAGSA